MPYKCPKCGSAKTESCCGGKRYKCKACGFSAPERIFKSGKLPSNPLKGFMASWPEVDVHPEASPQNP